MPRLLAMREELDEEIDSTVKALDTNSNNLRELNHEYRKITTIVDILFWPFIIFMGFLHLIVAPAVSKAKGVICSQSRKASSKLWSAMGGAGARKALSEQSEAVKALRAREEFQALKSEFSQDSPAWSDLTRDYEELSKRARNLAASNPPAQAIIYRGRDFEESA